MLRRSIANLIVLGGYAAASFALFGWRLLPHPGRSVIGSGHDPEVFIWSFAWWPHAIGSWTNPFVTHALYAPTGVNLAWTASAPGLALVFSPVTLLFGPVASYNLAALVLPALSAWTAYLLCRHLTGSIWASVIGGYIFGFSASTLNHQLLGHLHVTGVFLLPLVALVVVRYVEEELTARELAVRLGVLVAAQVWISTEFAFTLTLALVLGLLLAFGLVRGARPRLRASAAPIAAGYGLAAILAAPVLVAALVDFVSSSFVTVRDSTELLNFVVPTKMIGLGGSSSTSVSSHFVPGGAGAYLGLPTLVIVAAFAVRRRRAAEARFLVAALAILAVVTLGTSLRADGHTLVSLPWWRAATHLPGLNHVYPFRFSVYVALTAAVIVAVWTATTKGWVFPRPYVLPVLAVAALLPAVWRTSYPSFRPVQPERPAFFADDLYKACIPRGETVAIFPFGDGGRSMLWQAESGFWFRVAGDGLQPVPAKGKPMSSFDADPTVAALNFLSDRSRPTMSRLLGFAATHHVDRVISVADDGYPSRAQMRRFGPTQLVGGVLVAPACGQPSLATRDLTPFAREAAEQVKSEKTLAYCLGPNYYTLPLGLYPAGVIKGATPALLVAGTGLTCSLPPGYKRHGFATPDLGVPPNTYPYYAP